MNEPKLEIVEVPDEALPNWAAHLDDGDLVLIDRYGKSPSYTVLSRDSLPIIREHLNKGMVEVNAVACGSTIVYNPRNEDMSEKASKGRTCYYVKILVPAKEGE